MYQKILLKVEIIYKIRIFTIALLVLFFYQTQSQTRSFAGLPQFRSKTPPQYKDNLNHTDEYEHILGIYEKLVEAKGDKRMPVPKLNLRAEEGFVASMDYRLLDISLEKKAYDVAKQYGDEAIAFLLAHELVHYYERHGWRRQFTDEVSDMETSRILKLADDGFSNEVQADVLGGFLAYSAGFGLFEKGDSLITALYRSYKFPNILAGYPSRADRIELARRNKVQIEKLTSLFEAATYFTITGKYKDAYAYYGHLLSRYQSAEIYNNAGLTCLLAGVARLDSSYLPLQFPFFLDLDFSQGSRNAGVVAEVSLSLSEAIRHFESAILMNPSHLLPYLNKTSACIIQHAITKDPVDKARMLATAKFMLETEIPKVISTYDDRDYSSLEDASNVLQSILAYYENNLNKAVTLLDLPVKNKNSIALHNLRVLQKEPPMISFQADAIKRREAAIDQTNAESFLKSRRIPKNLTRIDDERIFRYVDTKQNHIVLLCENKGNEVDLGYDFAFLTHKTSYKGIFVEGLKIGQPFQEYINKMGQPAKKYNHLNGWIYLFYPNIIIFTDNEENVYKVVDFHEILK